MNSNVPRGTKIGEAGHSGWTWPACAGNHLHFHVLSGGTKLNPYFVEKPGVVYTGDNLVSQNEPSSCCSCSTGLAFADAPPLGGNPVGPPDPQPDPPVAFDLTTPGDLSAAPRAPESPVVDTTPPLLTAALADAGWTNTPAQAVFTWPAAVDESSGLAGYQVYWGPDENGTATTPVTGESYTPAQPDTSSGAATYYLRVAPLDKAGNLGEWQTIHVWRYDALPPSGPVQVNNGGETSPTLPVVLNLSAADEHGGVAQMRFSLDGLTWGEWEAYAPTRAWQLADVDGPQTIYTQFRDAAGNVSAPVSTAIGREFVSARPSADNYRIARSGVGMGGGAKASTGYKLLGTSGQPYQTGAMQSNNYRLASGYWAQAAAPTNQPPNVPTNPNPATGSTNVAVTAVLSWTGSDPENDPLTYEVRFGTANPPPQVVVSQSAASYDPPGNLANNTTYYWQIVAKDAVHPSGTAGPVWSFTTAGGPPSFPNVFYISPAANITLGGIAAQGADILRYTKSSNNWTMVYDGSVRGTAKNISAFALTDDGSLLLVFSANQVIAGLGTATPFDVVRFTPNTPGVFPLGAGTYSWFFQGKTKGLTTASEKIDALDLVGVRLLLSTTGAASVPLPGGGVLKAADEDAFTYNPTNNEWLTPLRLDGSVVPGLAAEDVNGIWDDPQNDDYYITILGAFDLGGVKGTDKSIVRLIPNGAGGWMPSLVDWLAPGAAFAGKIDGLEMVR